MNVCVISFGPVESKSNGYFIRCYNIIKTLKNLGYDVLLIEFIEGDIHNNLENNGDIPTTRIYIKRLFGTKLGKIFRNSLSFDPFNVVMLQLSSFISMALLRSQLKKSNVILVEGALFPFVIIVAKIMGKKVILDTHNINKLLALRFKQQNKMVYFLRMFLWDMLERFTFRVSDAVLVVSKEEGMFVEKHYGIKKEKIFYVPNIIDVSKKEVYSTALLKSLKKRWNLYNKTVVTFVGDLMSIQNRDATNYILGELAPFFWKMNKNVVFLIIGRGGEKFNVHFPNVVFTGFVKDLDIFMEISDFFIAPLRIGSGTKTKILHYLLYNKPIITTPIGIEGLNNLKSMPNIHIVSIDVFKYKLLELITNEKIIDKKYQVADSVLSDMYRIFERNLIKSIQYITKRNAS